MSRIDAMLQGLQGEKHAVQIGALRIELIPENVRCVALATGRLVYEFWANGKVVVRHDVAALDAALASVRANPQDEETPWP